MSYFDATQTICNPEPDFAGPRLELPQEVHDRMLQRLQVLYPDPVAQSALAGIERILQVFYAYQPLDLIERERDFNPAERFTERDVILITYGDLLYKRHQSPLKTLGDFCDSYIRGTINTLHVLPFFSSSSDRGRESGPAGTLYARCAGIWGRGRQHHLPAQHYCRRRDSGIGRQRRKHPQENHGRMSALFHAGRLGGIVVDSFSVITGFWGRRFMDENHCL